MDRWITAIAVAAALASSGCLAGGNADGGLREASSSEPEAVEESGTNTQPTPQNVGEGGLLTALVGRVLDDELRPVGGAQVSLVSTNLFDVTAQDGTYRLTSIPGGWWNLRAEADGYAGLTLRVWVADEGHSWANFTIEPRRADVAYIETRTRTAFIDVAESETHYSAASKVNQTCRDCKIPLWLSNNPRQLMVEFTFVPSMDYDNYEEQIFFSAYWNTTVDGPFGQDEYHPSHYVGRGSAPAWGNVTYNAPTDIRGSDGVLTLYLDGDRIRPMINQRIDLWISVAHHGEIPPGWTSAPPPEEQP